MESLTAAKVAVNFFAMSLKPVVAAAIIREEGGRPQLLAASRAYPADLRGMFELPGGKIEPGEEPRDALVREIREELSCDLEIGSAVLSDEEDGAWPVLNGRRMFVWLARAQSVPKVGDGHLEFRWLGVDDLLEAPWIEPDVPIAKAALKLAASQKARGFGSVE